MSQPTWQRIFSVLLLTGMLVSFLAPSSTQAAPQMVDNRQKPAASSPVEQAGRPAVGARLTDPVVGGPFTAIDTTGLPPVGPVEGGPQPAASAPGGKLLPKGQDGRGPSGILDPILQRQAGDIRMPAIRLNFEGIPATGVFPPDTDGQVGKDQYIQVVNAPGVGTQVRIWDKETGTQEYDFGMNPLWPSGDACNSDGYGDPVVLYDQMAERWILSQFSLPGGPWYQCVAISKTSTATNDPNDWYLYTFAVSANKMNDYPKIGVWPDGYYMTANQFTDGALWGGLGVWVFDRTAMLTGDPATFQYFDLYGVNPNYGGALPSNWMGSTPPPAGSPNIFAEVDDNPGGSPDDVLTLWEFHTDWVNTANTSFTLIKELVVAPFSATFPGTDGAEVPQPDTSQGLDDLADRLMMHLWYRNFGDHESLVVNHTVNNGSDIHAVRWYEIRGGAVDGSFADASIYQQSTFAPADGIHRWMGSIAMDHAGNVALGYSASNASVYPSIYYTGRLAGDPLGQMTQAEGVAINGAGSQLGADSYGRGRWGDYSAMSVDPEDDCTFWYTQEYVQTTGDANWQTRVASFKYPGCSLGSTGIISGTVTDSGANPLANATVQASASITQSGSVVSDADGT